MQTTDNNMLTRIDAALDTIRPHLKVDGGDLEIVEFTAAGILRIKWLGACESCNMSFMTMRAGIEQSLRAQVPEVKSVEAVNGVHSIN
jgi:Fe-S cluster biogenesis protein NfuA